ncbi:MAG: NAD(P)H-binding protein [Actinomyces urogenitalis]|nr:NAD(P)H-binding protein [Actinomyces urogenitalis]MDU6150748.1 NAD(P)H-binding protein [Actinomyces urogenitalis]MDU7428139.1 NAD(P)H-binding protein [Actinomyces urogenitalis]
MTQIQTASQSASGRFVGAETVPAGGRVLVVGTSGSIGQHAVRAACWPRDCARALVRDDSEAGMFPDEVEVIVADTSRPETLGRAVDGVHGVVSRAQIAQVLVASLRSTAATGKTLELVATTGQATRDLEALFAALEVDTGLEGVHDRDTLPLASEPEDVRQALEAMTEAFIA